MAHARVKSRARSEESVIPLSYLRELHDLHENWLLPPAANDENHDGNAAAAVVGTADSLPAPVLVIDADQDLAEMPDMFSKHEDGIFDSVKRHYVVDGADPALMSSPKKLARAF